MNSVARPEKKYKSAPKVRGQFAMVPMWLVEKRLSPSAIAVYVVLDGKFADAAGEAWPKRKTLAEAANVSVTTITKALKELKAAGAVTVTRRWRETRHGGQRASLYTVHRNGSEEQQLVAPKSRDLALVLGGKKQIPASTIEGKEQFSPSSNREEPYPLSTEPKPRKEQVQADGDKNVAVDSTRARYDFKSSHVRPSTLEHVLKDMWRAQFGEPYDDAHFFFDIDDREAVAWLSGNETRIPGREGIWYRCELSHREVQAEFADYLRSPHAASERHSIANFVSWVVLKHDPSDNVSDGRRIG